MACFSAIIIPIAFLFLLWGYQVGTSHLRSDTPDDDDNPVVSFLNALPIIIIAVMFLFLYLADRQTVQSTFNAFGVTRDNFRLTFIILGVPFFIGLIILHKYYYVPWRLKRWAERRGFKLISHRPTKVNVLVNSLLGRSKYQQFYTLVLQDKERGNLEVDAVIGSYWGTNPNKFTVSWPE